MNKTLILSNFISFKFKAKCSVLEGQVLEGQVLEGQVLEGQVLEGQVLEHALTFVKVEVLSARVRYRAPNARALPIILYLHHCIIVY
jgi:hypothetical protein